MFLGSAMGKALREDNAGNFMFIANLLNGKVFEWFEKCQRNFQFICVITFLFSKRYPSLGMLSSSR